MQPIAFEWNRFLGPLYVIFTLFEYSARIRITRTDATLNTLRFWVALSFRSLDFKLKLTKILLLLAALVFSAAPASLWATCITPQLSSAPNDLETLSIPVLGQDGFAQNVNGQFLTHCSTISTFVGTFSSCPAKQFLSSIIVSAGTASDPTHNVSRFDTTQYIYTGRSYGIAAAVGITDWNLADEDETGHDYVTFYNYTEVGFDIGVSCSYLSNSPWQIIPVRDGDIKQGIPYIFWAGDTGANDLGYYATWSLYDSSDIVAWSAKQLLNSSIWAIYIAAGQHYEFLSNVSCTVEFKPKYFDVQVDKMQMTIKVRPGSDFGAVLDPDSHLRTITMQQLGIVSQVSTTLYFSAIGDALTQNTANSADNLTAVADSLANMLDAIVLALTSTQAQLPGFQENSSLSQQVPVPLEFTVARTGNQNFIFTMSILNAIIILVLLFFMIRTRFWKSLPRFSYLDIGSVVVASAVGDIRRDVCRATEIRAAQTLWADTKAGQRIGEIAVGVSERDVGQGRGMLALDSNLITAGQGGQTPEDHELLLRGESSAMNDSQIRIL